MASFAGHGAAHFPSTGAAVPSVSDHLDPRLAASSSQSAISCDKRSIQSFSESQISSIIGGKTVPHLPDAGEQNEMRISGKRKVSEIAESFGAPFSGDDGRAHVAA
jgi:hypothetical protein